MFETPILFLIYKRPDLTEVVFEAIRRQQPKYLFVAADGPKENKPEEKQRCLATRKIIEKIDWDCQVKTLFRENNLGCKKAVSSAINWFFEHVDQGIVLEDDCLPEPSFFRFCEDLLRYYKNDSRVFQITGNNMYWPRPDFAYSYFFTKYVEIWGWATWKRAWKFFDIEMKNFSEASQPQATLDTVFDNRFEFEHRAGLFQSVIDNKLDSWANIWAYVNFINNGLTIIPKVNLVSNIGFANQATHTADVNSSYSNLNRSTMDFPLKHPTYIIQPKQYNINLNPPMIKRTQFLKLKNRLIVFLLRLKQIIKKLRSGVFTMIKKSLPRPLLLLLSWLKSQWRFGDKIVSLQLPVTDKCNSHCVMCNIWKNVEHLPSLSPRQYREILSDKLFKNIEQIGVNGGEPSLRPDLFEVVKACNDVLPKLKSITLITNGLLPDRIFKLSVEIFRFLKQERKHFTVMVSLDGARVEHDLNRGTAGSFDSSTNLIKKIQSAGIDLMLGCTLTKKNVYAGDDLLLFAGENKINNLDIRLGIDIKRLNNEFFWQRQNFSVDEWFHLCQFFQSLAQRFPHKTIYYSLFRQLAYKESRLAGCTCKKNTIGLDPHGNLFYCSVVGNLLGSALVKSAKEIYRQNIKERDAIIKDDCNNCLHDFDGPLSFKNFKRIFDRQQRQSMIVKKINQIKSKEETSVTPLPEKKKLADCRSVIITGWWGTETHGDKAILGELIDFLNKKCPRLESFYLTCFDEMEYVIDKTIEELAATKIVDVSKFKGTIPIVDFYRDQAFTQADFVIIGGGPLERIAHLRFIEQAFHQAVKNNQGTMIFGCGIDPYLGDYESAVKNIINNSQYLFFRDAESLAYAKKITSNSNLNAYFACDPSLNFLNNWRTHNKQLLNDKHFDCCTLLRANTAEYLHDQNERDINQQNCRLVEQVARFVDANSNRGKFIFLSMNNLWIGKDDRINNRAIINSLEEKNKVEYFRHEYMSLDKLLKHIVQSKMSLAARYHGHLFSLALNVPFISVDYTGQGNKINNLLKRLDLEDLSLKWGKTDPREIQEKFDFIKNNFEKLKKKLDVSLYDLITRLEKVYEKFD
jgi:MoaA/NifB/PqqE/SkfB family radical SAM enzyme/polysaccharide pyruvyl transferase WcaK-like protein